MGLEDFLINEKKYQPGDAAAQVVALTSHLKQNLEEYQKVQLPHFGSLIHSGTGLIFEPSSELSALISSQDLSALKVNPIPKNYQGTEEGKMDNHTFVDPDSPVVQSAKNRWLIPLVLLFLLVGIGLIAYFLYKEKTPTLPAPVVNDSLVSDGNLYSDTTLYDTNSVDTMNSYIPNDTIASSDYSTETAPPITDDASATHEEYTSDTTPAEVQANAGAQTCAVIVGVMAQHSNVVKLSKRIKKMGYTPFSYVSKGLTRIGAATDCDEESIARTMKDMKTLSPDAWLYSK